MATAFFDFDGTLHDTMRLYGPAFRTAYAGLVRAGWAPPRDFRDEEISCWLGWRIEDMWRSFMPGLPEAVWRGASHVIGSEMRRLLQAGRGALYDGIELALDELVDRGISLVLLSNSDRSYCDTMRAAFGLDRWFGAYRLAGDYPGMEKWEYCARAMELHEGPFVVVGDRFHDIDAAVRCRVASVGCLWGCGLSGELERATVKLASPAELPSAICGLLA